MMNCEIFPEFCVNLNQNQWHIFFFLKQKKKKKKKQEKKIARHCKWKVEGGERTASNIEHREKCLPIED